VVLGGALMVLLALASTYGVARRYVFGDPDPHVYELNLIFLLLCFVVAVSGVERLNRHIRVDLIATHMPQGAQVILLNIIGPIVGLFLCAILTWKGWSDAWYAFSIGQVSASAWPVPLSPIKIIIPIGYALLCLVLIARLYRGLVSLKTASRR
jgi:TRAP-type mannitol/chloroaromatic compound transport system permease small subunit